MRHSDPPHTAQTGAITIMVALMLLVLLTISAVGIARNSFREIVTSGFGRQGAMAQDVADSGLEWSVYWIDMGNAQGATGTAKKIATEKAVLAGDDTLVGKPYNIFTGADYVPGGTLQTAMELSGPAGVTQGFTIGLTRMGKLPIAGFSQSSGQGAYAPAAGGPVLQAPDLWAIRSDAQVIQGGVTFTHGKEAWVSTPIQ